MSKTRSRSGDYPVYLVVRVVVVLLQTLSFRAATALAGVFAQLVYQVDGRHRRVADENLRHAFPELDAPGRDRAIRAVYQHFCLLVIEIICLPRRIHATNWKKHIFLG